MNPLRIRLHHVTVNPVYGYVNNEQTLGKLHGTELTITNKVLAVKGEWNGLGVPTSVPKPSPAKALNRGCDHFFRCYPPGPVSPDIAGTIVTEVKDGKVLLTSFSTSSLGFNG